MILTSNMQPTAFTHRLDILTTKLLNRYCSIPVDAQSSQAGFHQVWRNFQAAEYISFSQLEITYLAHIYTAKFNHISQVLPFTQWIWHEGPILGVNQDISSWTSVTKVFHKIIYINSCPVEAEQLQFCPVPVLGCDAWLHSTVTTVTIQKHSILKDVSMRLKLPTVRPNTTNHPGTKSTETWNSTGPYFALF